jgi:nitroreductase
VPFSELNLPGPDLTTWRPEILTPGSAALDALVRSGRVRELHDTLWDQLAEYVSTLRPAERLQGPALREAVLEHLAGEPLAAYGRWVHYPWSGRLVHVLPPDAYRRLRSDRNRYKISEEEQARLRRATIGVVGLSVGQAAALTLALEGIGGRLRLADMDTLGLSNLNRLRAGVHELGLNKAVIAARAIAEIDPYLDVEIHREGVRETSLGAFLDGLDLLVEECDDLPLKLRLREEARARRIPVVMDTSDRGLLDVERFDLEPERALLHGRVGALRAADVSGLDPREKVGIVLQILGIDTISTRLAATLPEVGRHVSTWPQLASGVALGGALVADTARRILLGQDCASGRFHVDLETLVGGATAPEPAARGAADGHAPAARRRGPGLDATTREIAAAAASAPSGHNAQPWRFRRAGYTFDGRFDPARRLHALDFHDAASWAALGSASLNAELAARASGRFGGIELGPTEGEPLLGFRLRLASGPVEEDPLHPWIARRVTNRRLAERRPLGAAAAALEREAAAEGAWLCLATTPREIEALATCVALGERLTWLQPEVHGEIVAGLRWSAAEVARGDGLDVASLELSPSDLAVLRLLARPDVRAAQAHLGLGQGLGEFAGQAVRASSAVGLLAVPGASPQAWIAGGRAQQRVWLRATALGLSIHPFATVPYLLARHTAGEPDSWTREIAEEILKLDAAFRDVFPRMPGTTELLLFRITHAPPPSARALRRPLHDVVDPPGHPSTTG